MQTLAILGSGDLAATLVRRVAERSVARHIVLVDPEVERARGKALDIAQSGPVDGFDVSIEAVAALEPGRTLQGVVIADTADMLDAARAKTGGATLLQKLVPLIGDAFVVVAGAHARPVVEAGPSAGLKRERVLGSVAIALAAAVQRRVAAEVDVEAGAVSLALLGAPPDHLIVPSRSLTIAGLPVDTIAPTAVRRAVAAVGTRTLGPVALAAAALRLLQALDSPRATALPVLARLDGEYGHRGPALCVPARVGGGRLIDVLDVPLEPFEKIALGNAAEPRVSHFAR